MRPFAFRRRGQFVVAGFMTGRTIPQGGNGPRQWSITLRRRGSIGICLADRWVTK